MIVAKYKFNPNTYSDYLPTFNNGYTYTKSDVTNSDGSITRTINSDSLPTVMKFGDSSATTRASSLLEILDMNTSNLTTMDSMFRYCDNLTNISCSWDTNKVTNMNYMFSNCSSLTSVVIDSWDTSQVITMMSMFFLCSSLTSLDLSNWNTSRLTNTSYMFKGCSKLPSLDINNWDTSRLTNMNYMFSGCSSLTSLDLSNWNTSKVKAMNYAFDSCTSLITLDLSNWHISESIGIIGFFVGNMPNLYKINLKYADEYTVSKAVAEFPNRSSTTPGYVLSSVDFTSTKNWQRIKSSHNNFYLPQPLNKMGDIKDRLYWDEDKGHYCIEQNISLKTFNKLTFTGGNVSDNVFAGWGNFNIDGDYDYRIKPIINHNNKHIKEIFLYNRGSYTEINISIKDCATIDDANIKLNEDLPLTIVFVKLTPNIIDLPHLNQKLTFDSYNPSTTIDIPNRPLKASKTYLDAPIARYRCTNLQPSTQYNVQFDCKGDIGIKVNLGGTEATFTPTSEWTRKNLTITTPSELVNDKLSISNVGITANNIVDNVMLFSEVIAQEPDYIDDIQSIGELQDDGTYKIDICARPDCEYVYNKGVSNDTFIFENGSKEENNQLILTHNENGRITTTKSYTISPKVKILIKIVYADQAHGSYKFRLILNKAIINQSKQDIIYDSISDKGYYLFEYENITNSDIISSICIGNYFGEYHIESIAIVYNDSKYSQSIYLPQPLRKIRDIKDKFYWDDDKGHYCIEQNVSDNLEVLSASNIIDLPEMNQKFSFDTYLPNTYVDVTNLPLQPYKLQLEDDTVRYKSTIETSTLYTIQFNCVSKLTTRLTLDLGGTRKTVDPIIGVNHVQITTPSELASDRLFLIGTGIVVKEVIVNKGDMNQYPKYFDGEQSVGELQEDGTYRIDVLSENEFKNINLWDGKKVSDYATDFIEIYDNTFSLNSYDAYITEYDADRQLITSEYTTSTANRVLTTKNSNCKYITVRSNIFKETDIYYVKEGLLVLSNRMVSFKEKPIGFRNSLKVSIFSNSPLAKGDKLYWNDTEKRYEIDRNGAIEVPTVEGDIIDLPRLYQKIDTTINISTDNIEPSKIDIEYNDINNN